MKGGQWTTLLYTALSVVILSACATDTGDTVDSGFTGLQIKLLVGSALEGFCNQATEQFNL